MTRYWASWYSGDYEDEGCTTPPFQIWYTGQADRPDNGLSPENLAIYEKMLGQSDGDDQDALDEFLDTNSRTDATICAEIVADSEEDVWELVAIHYPDYRQRFCDEMAPDQKRSSRFQ